MRPAFASATFGEVKHTVPEGARVRIEQDGVVHTDETYGTYVDWDGNYVVELLDQGPELPGRAEEHFQAINADGVLWYTRNALGVMLRVLFGTASAGGVCCTKCDGWFCY